MRKSLSAPRDCAYALPSVKMNQARESLDRLDRARDPNSIHVQNARVLIDHSPAHACTGAQIRSKCGLFALPLRQPRTALGKCPLGGVIARTWVFQLQESASLGKKA